MSQQHTPAKSQWSSRIGFLMAAVGSAVGLGSIWKFPYMTGEGGGSAFVILFVICITLIGFPVLIMEWLIGRRGGRSPVGSFVDVARANAGSSTWGILGGLGTLAAFLILSFYSVIGGWSLNYVFKTLFNQFNGMNGQATEQVFNGMLASAPEMTIWHTIFMLLTALIVAGGVAGGIERAAKWMMPLLALIMLVIVGYNLFTADFARGFHYLFDFDPSKVTAKVMISALGHAFFCLSLGMAVMVSYGSYLKGDVDLFSAARTVVIWDIIFSLMAGLAIFPIIFSNGLDPAGGPGLVFITLPIAFGNMSFGLVIGTLFFLLLTFAALTSSISVLEPVVAFLQEKLGMSRRMATWVGALSTWALGVLALLSFNLLQDVTIFTIHVNGEAKPQGIFDALDYTTSKYMLPLIGLGTVLFMTYVVGQDSIREELRLEGYKWILWKVATRVVAPLGIVLVFLAELGVLNWFGFTL